jgi:polar amino acid transport system ATP-binding protein
VTELLRIDGLRLSRGQREILKGIALRVERGQVVALMGLSGSGKSTALRATVALESFQAGRIEVEGFSLVAGPVPPESRLTPLRRKVGMVFQGQALFEHLTALENVVLAPVRVAGASPAEARERAMALLDNLGIVGRAGARPRELSGGEAQRVAIARALAMDPPLLLMDEPTAALDPARRGSLGETLRRLAGERRGLLVATHDTDFARDFADRVIILADGVVAEEGPPALLESPSHPATRALLEHPQRHESVISSAPRESP